MELAKRRQQQIDANEQFIDELQRQQHSLMLAKRNGLCVRDEADRLRDSIQRDEQTLQQLGSMKRDVMQTRQEMQGQRQVRNFIGYFVSCLY
jgi:dynactin complex subunit